MFAATNVILAFLFVPAIYHVVAVRRSGEESVLVRLAKHRTERGRNASEGRATIGRTFLPVVAGAMMVIPSSLPHPVDVEVGRYRAGSQDGAGQKEEEER